VVAGEGKFYQKGNQELNCSCFEKACGSMVGGLVILFIFTILGKKKRKEPSKEEEV